MSTAQHRVVLMLASERDLHADAVLLGLEACGVGVVRIDPESDWSERTSITVEPDDARAAGEIVHRGRAVPLESITAVHCRSWQFRRARDYDPIEEHLRLHEMRAGLMGLARSLQDRFWINRPWREEAVESKMVQAIDARRFGLETPESIVTSDPEAALRFFDRCEGDVVVKQLSDVSLIDDSEADCEEGVVYGFFTERVPREAIEQGGEAIRSAPVLLQRRVEKAADLRVTVVGERVFVHRIESQASAIARTDFRKDLSLLHAPIDLPPAITDRLVAMVRSWGLHFAACDLIETPEGRHVFLEANPSGNWLWLEGPDRHPILEAVVEDLAMRERAEA